MVCSRYKPMAIVLDQPTNMDTFFFWSNL